MGERLDYFYRRVAGTSVLVAMCPDERGAVTPVVLHWGADLGDIDGDDVAALVEAYRAELDSATFDVRRMELE